MVAILYQLLLGGAKNQCNFTGLIPQAWSPLLCNAQSWHTGHDALFFFAGTGDVIEDMGKQLQANNIRINILEEENMRLRAAVVKMKEATQQGAPKVK